METGSEHYKTISRRKLLKIGVAGAGLAVLSVFPTPVESIEKTLDLKKIAVDPKGLDILKSKGLEGLNILDEGKDSKEKAFVVESELLSSYRVYELESLGENLYAVAKTVAGESLLKIGYDSAIKQRRIQELVALQGLQTTNCQIVREHGRLVLLGGHKVKLDRGWDGGSLIYTTDGWKSKGSINFPYSVPFDGTALNSDEFFVSHVYRKWPSYTSPFTYVNLKTSEVKDLPIEGVGTEDLIFNSLTSIINGAQGNVGYGLQDRNLIKLIYSPNEIKVKALETLPGCDYIKEFSYNTGERGLIVINNAVTSPLYGLLPELKNTAVFIGTGIEYYKDRPARVFQPHLPLYKILQEKGFLLNFINISALALDEDVGLQFLAVNISRYKYDPEPSVVKSFDIEARFYDDRTSRILLSKEGDLPKHGTISSIQISKSKGRKYLTIGFIGFRDDAGLYEADITDGYQKVTWKKATSHPPMAYQVRLPKIIRSK